jgi:hypothetical protein
MQILLKFAARVPMLRVGRSDQTTDRVIGLIPIRGQ